MIEQESVMQQGSQWNLNGIRIGIVRVGEYKGSDAAELLLRSEDDAQHALVTVDGRTAEFNGWTVRLMAAERPKDRAIRETVHLKAVRA